VADKQIIPFGEFAPDRSVISGQSPMIKGVLPLSGRYAPLPDLQQVRAGSMLNDRCLGGKSFYDKASQASVTFLADHGRLYRVIGKVPSDVSKSAGYSFSFDWGVAFEQFGDNIVAVGRGVTPQRYVFGSSSLFADLANAPTGDTVFRIRNHLFICEGNVVNCSGFNNITIWDPSTPGAQAFQNEVNQANGLIVAGWGGEQGAIFQERGIVRLTYTGAAAPFIFDEVEGGRGVCGPNAWSPWGKIAFCAAEDGFYTFDGLAATPIGADRVDRYFASRLNYGYRHRVWASIDAKRKCWMVAFPTEGAIEPNEVLIYSWSDNKWTWDEFDSQYGFEMHREPVDADDEAGLIELFGTADADDPVFDTISADSPLFRESRAEWAVINGDRKLCQFTGANRAADLSTATYDIAGRKTFVSELWPVTDAPYASVSGQVATRLRRLDEVETVSPVSPMNAEGFCPVYAEGRYQRGLVGIAAGAAWTEATGVHHDGRESGER
jgi:hypothetical protein